MQQSLNMKLDTDSDWMSPVDVAMTMFAFPVLA